MARLSEESIAYSAAALQAGDVHEAIAIRNREFSQECGTFDESIVRTMELILSSSPKLFADCPAQVLAPLRIAAAMMELWGKNSVRRFVSVEGDWNYRFGIDAVAGMLLSHGCSLRSLENYRRVGISKVSILGPCGPDDCSACRAADGKSFTVDTVPELPLADCTCSDRYGCRLIMIADGKA